MDETAPVEKTDEIEDRYARKIEKAAAEAGHPGKVRPDTADTPLDLVGGVAGTVAEVAGKTVEHAVGEAVSGSSPVGTVSNVKLHELFPERFNNTGRVK